jgi:hypothetical protein
LIHDPEMSAEARKLIAEKRAQYESRSKKNTDVGAEVPVVPAEVGEQFPPGATLCNKCNAKATIIMDGCATCLNCGYSKCG